MYYTYIIRVEGGMLYTGIAKNLFTRMAEHAGRGKRCAKYTRSRPLVSLEALWSSLGIRPENPDQKEEGSPDFRSASALEISSADRKGGLYPPSQGLSGSVFKGDHPPLLALRYNSQATASFFSTYCP